MYIARDIANPDYALEFLLMVTKEIWPEAMILDENADVRYGHGPIGCGGPYGRDIYPSERDVEEVLTGDSENCGPYVNVHYREGRLHIQGDAQVVRHISQHPLWIKS